MGTLAIIPARGGSQRIPRKNLCTVGGQSLIERAILSAWPCDAIVVASDDREMREHAVKAWVRHSGAARIDGDRWPEMMAVQLDAKTAAGTTHLEEVIAAVLREVPCEECDIGDPDTIVLLQPTSPFRTAAHVSAALGKLAALRASAVTDAAVLSVTLDFHVHDYFVGDTYDGDRWTQDRYQERPFSQDVAGLGYENGAIYAFTRETWDRTKDRKGDIDTDLRRVPMHWSEAVDVDTPADLAAAERLAR